MANYLSNPFEVSPVKSSINLPLLDKVMGMRQGKYDANKSQIDQTLALYQERLRGRRDIDNQYIAKKISDVRTSIDQTGDIDWSRSYNTEGALNKINSLVKDPAIMSAVLNKAKVDQYNMQVSELKKKDPNNYSDVNYQYGLYKAGVNAYDRGEAKDIGELNYVPYTDLTEEHLKKIKTIKDLKGKRFVEVADGQGGIQRREIEGLTEDEIQSYFGSLMTSEELTQMKINGWAKYGQNEAKAREYFTDYNTKKLGGLEQQLESAKANAKSTVISPVKQQEAELQVKSLETEIENLKTNINNVGKLPVDELALSLEKSTYLNGLANIASTEWSYSEKADELYFKQKELELDYEDLAIKKAKELRETAEFTAKMQKEYGLNPDGTIATQGQTSVASSEDVLEDNPQGFENLKTLHDSYFKTINDAAKNVLNKVDQDERETFVTNLKKYGLDENLNKLPNFPKGSSVANNIKKAFDDSGLAKIYKEDSDALTNAQIKKNSIAKDLVTVEKDSYYKKFTEAPDKYLTKIVEETMTNTASLDMNPKDLEKLRQSGDKIKELYQKATGKELVTKIDILGQAQPVGKTWYQVKQELKKAITDRPTLVLDLSNITEYTGKQSLKEDSKAVVEATLSDRARRQVLSTMTVYDDINLTNANTRDRLIQMMPQSRIEGALFKKDLPMTIKRKGENLEIIQYHGQENIPGAKGEKRAVASRITIDKGDVSLFNEIAKYVDYEESDRMSYNAEKFKSFEEVKPQVNNNKDRKDSNYETKNAVAVAKSVQNNPEIARPFIVSKNPQIWSTAPLIEKNMKGYLTTIVGEEQAKAFTDEYMKNINSFRVKPVTAMSPILGVKTWSLEIYSPYNKKLDVKDLGVQNMDKDTKYLIDHHPEVYISEFLAQSIKEDPQFINAVFKQ